MITMPAWSAVPARKTARYRRSTSPRVSAAPPKLSPDGSTILQVAKSCPAVADTAVPVSATAKNPDQGRGSSVYATLASSDE